MNTTHEPGTILDVGIGVKDEDENVNGHHEKNSTLPTTVESSEAMETISQQHNDLLNNDDFNATSGSNDNADESVPIPFCQISPNNMIGLSTQLPDEEGNIVNNTITNDFYDEHDVEADQIEVKKYFTSSEWGHLKPLKPMSSRSRSVDLFSIEKLYGRREEHLILLDSYRRITRCPVPRMLHFVLISGPSGTGKTKLAESIRQIVRMDGGYLCCAKFDQLNRVGVDPLVPFITAVADFVVQLLEEENKHGKKKVKKSLKDELRDTIKHSVDSNILATLTCMIPPLVDLLGRRRWLSSSSEHRRSLSRRRVDAATTPRVDAANYSIFALQNLMRVIASPERPLVVMLDDLQWTNQSVLDILRTFLLDTKMDGIMFLGTCRNDVAPTSDLSTFLRRLETDDKIPITNIALSNLNLPDVYDMVADMFHLPEETSSFLSKLLFHHSDGNFFYIVEILRVLQYDKKLLLYNVKTRQWRLNSTEECRNYCSDCDIGEFLERRLTSLPQNVQKVLMVAACLGSRIEENLLYHALQEPVSVQLTLMVEQGVLVFDESRERYHFRHDKIQAASFGLISEELRPAFHLEVGRRLWQHLSSAGAHKLDKYLFVVLSQIKEGSSLLVDQTERYEVIGLCIRVAEKYAMSSSFQTALEYLTFALSLLGDNHWEEAYDLSLILYNHAAEMEFCVSDNTRVDALLNEVLENATEFSDKIGAYSTQVYVMGVRGDMELAIDTAVEVLEKLGVNLRSKNHFHLVISMTRIRNRLRGKSAERIKRLPHMDDPNKIAAMQMLNMLFLNSFLTRPQLFPFVVLKMMKLTLTDGLSAMSAVAFAGYGTLLCIAGFVNEGLRYGKISLDLLEEFEAKSFLPRCSAFVWGFIRPYARPWTELLEPLKAGHRIGLQTGDIEFALLNATFHTLFMLDSGSEPLPRVARQLSELKEMTEMHGQADQLGIFKPFLACLTLLMGEDSNLFDNSVELDIGLQDAIQKRNSFAVEILLFSKSFLHFLAGDFKLALEVADSQSQHTFKRIRATIHHTFGLWFDGMISFARARQYGMNRQNNNNENSTTSINDPRYSRRSLIQRGRSKLRILKRFAKTCPYHCLAKSVLLEAEYAAVNGKHRVAHEKYGHAIALASEAGCPFERAISNHVLGRHYISDLSDWNLGVQHYRAAIQGYDEWGACSVSHLLSKACNELLVGREDHDHYKQQKQQEDVQQVVEPQLPVEEEKELHSH